MMCKFICLLALVSAASAASIGSTVETTTEKRVIVPLLRFETDRKPDGSFSFSYEGGDNSAREESGVVENAGTEDEALEVHGSYRYIDADGQEIEVHYTAGKNGFVPVGTNIPAEISAAAKSAADQPNEPVVNEKVRRTARSIKANEEGGEEKENKGETKGKGEKEENEKEVKKVEKGKKGEKGQKAEGGAKEEKRAKGEKGEKVEEVEKETEKESENKKGDIAAKEEEEQKSAKPKEIEKVEEKEKVEKVEKEEKQEKSKETKEPADEKQKE